MANFYQEDPHLSSLLKKYLPVPFYQWADRELHAFGEHCAGDIDERAIHTDREGQPRLVKYDKLGEEVSRVWVNEGYKRTVEETYNTGIVGYIHKEIPGLGRKGNYVYSFAQGYLLSHAEPGFYCPVTLTMATAYLIDHYADEELKERFLPHVLATGEIELYEGATFLTERQGGSDVGANQVRALETADGYRIYGEKYFASNAGQCGVAMVLARMEGAKEGTKGLSLFLVPWEENRKNQKLHIRRLKDKLGVRAVPSAEVEFDGAKAYLVGEAEQGFAYMVEALNLSRICNAVASLGIMKRAFLEARDYAGNRTAFGSKLKDFPMIQDTLTTLAAKQQVETSAVFAMIHRFDQLCANSDQPEEEQILLRLYIAILKKETAEQAIHFAHEALEIHGGNGYIEDFVTPRLLRDAQVLTVWEGTGNILGLEVLRLVEKYQADHLFFQEVSRRLAALPESLRVLREQLELEIKRMADWLEEVKKADREIRSYYCKEIAKKFASVFESVVALEDAAESNGRNKDVAEVFMQSTWNSGTYQTDPMTIRHFQRIVESSQHAAVSN
ncbi:isovaleryl-CoA dehydrogenase [Sediminibacillus dalangtanensis]|uniref:Isovaleryl-CoA dehydrogenase n=1 Tax=Sediminibacillus dalangtanensis TaxID=2729421 RepID=A0ABX7VTR1_9BACI|nr:acyl-CoA dehydrogenase family protein [Sediminibacillus dalangtanensis]QTN00342.1 isovaleryl-CoA dehydrogenase [Sediminibacillus dalangtanensis]